eukprot:TRINITY_DN63814_c0_g1_i1.p1 TRINITY_DN63814_c0_g1~~TRINITY_DN63814_c0_g1_i1.p1  ORF type:complete len:375 (+),score=54.73 TRINITY_DN63814_c0_g1_i1:122-1246(+)
MSSSLPSINENEEPTQTWPEWGKEKVKQFMEHLPDPDIVLAYDSVKLLRVLDRRLGYIYNGAKFVAIAYVVLVVFISEKQYLVKEKASGWVMTKVMHSQLSDLGVNWDASDRLTNPGEQGAVFIPTRVLVTKGQQQDTLCESPAHNCSSAKDCNFGSPELQAEECSENGFCLLTQWCPAEDPANAAVTETHYLDPHDITIWFQTFVHFHNFNLDVLTTDETKARLYPHSNANTYNLRDIIRMANMDLADFIENGALMLVNAIFDCDLDAHKCAMKVESQNIDTVTGYNHVHCHVYWENGVRKRDTFRMYGIRLLVLTTGLGSRTSMSQILLQISSAIALIGVAQVITDFWLQNVVTEAQNYKQQKIIKTEDFNE